MTNKHWTRRTVLKTAGAVAGAAALPAAVGQTKYPSRPVTLVVPFPPGGSVDVAARAFADAFSKALGAAVVINNRPGAGGLIGAEYVARAAPDGYRLLWASTSTLGIAPAVMANPPYDPQTAFQPISRLVVGPLVFVVNAELPVNNLREFIALAKEKPGKLNFGSPGAGSIVHLGLEYFKQRAGIDIVHVPYQGNGPALTDLGAGLIHMLLSNVGGAMSLAESGKVKALAVTTPERTPLMPNLPTVAEAGLNDFEIREWSGLVGPTGMPKEVVEKLSAAFAQAQKNKALQEVLRGVGFVSLSETPDEFAAAIKETNDKWRAVAKTANVSL
ncbi:Tripartite tricarboxylate transporter family receptor [Pigmentiphaga humi]|uniref:Tripartite tricarboxylate transporter family receptor n=1 Tax=Pigmentiphaga humi TaxID=2478468 RepID=A0A3P4B6Y0_9BURK|nr:tripartite tricarboxylate transporter substrate binding protein [Pigmentiphaga humi]VCU72049.1 Tripartite tricarboxylate transporter family receptor [Pigmentiphaga humi]